jgi:hypothetical protein
MDTLLMIQQAGVWCFAVVVHGGIILPELGFVLHHVLPTTTVITLLVIVYHHVLQEAILIQLVLTVLMSAQQIHSEITRQVNVNQHALIPLMVMKLNIYV